MCETCKSVFTDVQKSPHSFQNVCVRQIEDGFLE